MWQLSIVWAMIFMSLCLETLQQGQLRKSRNKRNLAENSANVMVGFSDKSSQLLNNRHAEKLNRPAEKLNRPVEKLNRPVEKLNRPVEKLSRHAEKLNRHVEKLNRHVEKLNRPAEKLNRPVEKLNRPAEKLNRPVEKLNRHAEKLNRPVEKLNRPVEKLNRPVEKFNRPAEKLNWPAEKLNRPAEKLNRPAKKLNSCKCVPYYQCTSGKRNDVNKRKNDDCGNFGDVCCEQINLIKPESRRECGKRNPYGVGSRTINDTIENGARFGEFPWMITLVKFDITEDNKKIRVFKCGGALIHPQAVLTAAHCVSDEKESDLNIRAGEWDVRKKIKNFPSQDRNISKIIIHPDYDKNDRKNDYAILILWSPVRLTDNIGVVCLPKQDEQFDGSYCLGSGWGKNKFGVWQPTLKKGEFPVLSHNACEDIRRKTRREQNFHLDKSFICAGGKRATDLCTGDDGSPLVCQVPNERLVYVQVGIFLWGDGCNTAKIPRNYANVAAVREWIDNVLSILETSD